MTEKRIELPLLLAMIAIPIALQAWHLDVAIGTATDEGVYAEVGRQILAGALPHRDIPLWHMPGLPLLIGLGRKLAGDLRVLRALYLLFNCAVAAPLYFCIKKLAGSAKGAFVGVFLYLSFAEMVHHDFRFIAIRQFSNGLWILFLTATLYRDRIRYADAIRLALATLAGFIFIPNLLTFAAVLVFSRELKRLWLIAPPAVAIGAYLALVPGALDQVVLAQVGRESVGRLARFRILFSGCDSWIYAIGTAPLLAALAFRPTRALATLGLALFAIAVLLPSYYLSHYSVGAAPAFALGAALATRAAGKCGLAAALAIAAIQLACVGKPLWDEWSGNEFPSYYELTRKMRSIPEPVLSLNPIYVVDADRALQPLLRDYYLRNPSTKPWLIQDAELRAAEARSCSILVEERARAYVPKATLERWARSYPVAINEGIGLTLLTHSPGCAP